MSTFRDRFRLLVNTLKNHPRVALLAHELRDPAPRAAIERAEAASRSGTSVPRSMSWWPRSRKTRSDLLGR